MKRANDIRTRHTIPLFTTDRFVRINSQWFFQTRESEPVGPFDMLQQAQEALNEFLGIATSIDEVRMGLKEFDWTDELELLFGQGKSSRPGGRSSKRRGKPKGKPSKTKAEVIRLKTA